MKVRTLRLLDRLFGVPACALLTLFRRLFAGGASPRPPEVRKILFIKLVEHGSTVLARHAFSAAAARVGRENVYCLVFEEYREVFDILGLVPAGNVISVPATSTGAALLGLAGALRAIRRAGIDTVVDLEFFARTPAVLSFLSGARTRVGLHGGPGSGPWRGNLLTHPVLFQPDLHTEQVFEVLVGALDLPASSLPALPFTPPDRRDEAPLFQPTPEDLARASSLLGAPISGPAPRLFLLNANAGDLEPLRRWPQERYLELARLLLGDYPDALVVFTGSPAEAAETAALAARVGSPRCLSVAGKTSLRDLFALCALCDALVTNDSGPGHFASLTSGRAVVLFGPETPFRWGPRSPRCRALVADLACSPCLSAYNNRRSSCRDNLCLQRIPTGEVLSAVRELLSGDPGRR